MMTFLFILCVILLILIVAALIRSSWEQKHFLVRDYTLQAEGPNGTWKAAVIADLHGAVYGKGNEELIRAIDRAAPDMILIPGDLITCRRGAETVEPPDLSLLSALASRYPVFYAPGNHEENYLKLHPEFEREVADTGAVFLMNKIVAADFAGKSVEEYTQKSAEKSTEEHLRKSERRSAEEYSQEYSGKMVEEDGLVGGDGRMVYIAGLALGDEYYVRGKQPQMPDKFVEDRLGPRPAGYTVLLAHNPGFFKAYAHWGSDCVISGHNHGGVIRLPLLGGVISASLHLFDRYDRGIFREGRSTMVLSAGLGMHTIHVRLFNRPELVIINFCGRK